MPSKSGIHLDRDRNYRLILRKLERAENEWKVCGGCSSEYVLDDCYNKICKNRFDAITSRFSTQSSISSHFFVINFESIELIEDREQ